MIREMTKADFEIFWPTFRDIVVAQESYAFDPQINIETAYQLWCKQTRASFVFTQNDQILGSYYIKSNGMGPSDHICNCGYMVSELARGKGIASKLCEHSQATAKALGYSAMQFNSVVSTNQIAIKLWQKLGFTIIGTIPEAYRHAQLGLVDSYIMHKALIR
ncbi:GNAT family N-acetyltransferase [Alginatibacterium sediminis]|uniref:GNAT family N-acetyltransferase n=1 Tax=Alginatibacterium sediminis TaxID=2164068 RepID=A0A420EBC2_9ALTE|nr:GNAT family N-acetyltransferase [Alginatibacterium sediminis]RKF17999.1 GNAT family N-acetyltransferase [Alginatibacterium sediminis]